MRALLGLAASLLLPLAAAGAQAPPAGERYTPTGIWRDAAWAESFNERWFGNQLRAMDEPTLQRTGSIGRFRHRFRLLVLPNDEPATSIRVDERRSGRALVRYVELDGAGGYAPGSIATDRRFSIDREDLRAIESALDRARLDALDPAASSEGEAADGTIRMCLHGTQFVFELVARGRTSFVTRSSCDLTPELVALVRLLEPLREP